MKNFESRRDRFEAFSRYDNPLINLSMELELPDYRPFCKANGLPPFHVFLYCLLTTVPTIDNFMYRVLDGEVIKIDTFPASYTVVNEDNNLNYASFAMSQDLLEFVARSVAAGAVARATRALVNDNASFSARQLKENIYTTCMPWLRLTAIEHPIYRLREADIPLFAWGKFSEPSADGHMTVPFSVQAHHGFVDGFHIHQLTQALHARIARLIA
jgi:chloramphenicol O-acetyltransferase type A